jgi:hypothetical protein
MNEVNKNICRFVTVSVACGFVIEINAQQVNAQLRRPLRQEAARQNNEGAKTAAAYDATTPPAEKYSNQMEHQSNQNNRQNNWDSKNENQKMTDYNAATIHHTNVQNTQAAQKEAVSSHANDAAASRGGKRFAGRR